MFAIAVPTPTIDRGERLVVATVPSDHGADADPADHVGAEHRGDRGEPRARPRDVGGVAQQSEHRERGHALAHEQRKVEQRSCGPTAASAPARASRRRHERAPCPSGDARYRAIVSGTSPKMKACASRRTSTSTTKMAHDREEARHDPDREQPVRMDRGVALGDRRQDRGHRQERGGECVDPHARIQAREGPVGPPVRLRSFLAHECLGSRDSVRSRLWPGYRHSRAPAGGLGDPSTNTHNG